MSMRRIALVVAVAAIAVLTFAGARAEAAGGRAGGVSRIYVDSQGLYFDTFVVRDPLPMRGRFQRLYPTGGPTGGPHTTYGPGEPGYLGGRWWVDVNGDNRQDEGDHFFLCPLLGPGRP